MKFNPLSFIENAAFAIAAIVALALSWYAIADLSITQFALPAYLAYGASAIYDAGAIYLALVAMKNAKAGDANSLTKFATFALVALSAAMNIAHAYFLGLSAIAMVGSAAAPIIFGILLHVFLHNAVKASLKETKRLAPSVGLLSWMFYFRDSLQVLKNTAKAKIAFANAQLATEVTATTEATQAGAIALDEVAQEIPASPVAAIAIAAHSAKEEVAKPVATAIAIDNLELPAWAAKLDHPVAMSILAKEAVANGVESAIEFINVATMLGIHVNEATAKSAFSRARKSLKEVTHG